MVTAASIASLLASGQAEEAEVQVRQALADHPDDFTLWRSLGSVLGLRHDHVGSFEAFSKSLALFPDDVPSLLGAGTCLHFLGRYHEGLELLLKAREIEPDNSRVLLEIGHLSLILHLFKQAQVAYLRVLSLEPDHARARLGLSSVLFALGDWAGGWAHYEARLEIYSVLPRDLDSSLRWMGGALPASLVIPVEQGIGDTLQFIRFIPEIVQAGTRVTLVCEPKLFALLSSLPCDFSLHSCHEAFTLRDGDTCAPLLSLPLLLGKTDQGLSPDNPYLVAEPQRISRWRSLLGSHGYKIGICWQGNPKHSFDRERSVPLEAFAALAKLPGVRLISLQKGYGEEQIVGASFKVETLGDDFDSAGAAFVDSAAVMMCLDEIITVDTALVHLAGTLGRRVQLILPRYNSDWRWWPVGDGANAWYPTLSVHRCPDDDISTLICSATDLLKPSRS